MPDMSKKIYFKYFFRRNCAKCAAQNTQEALKSLESRKFIIKKYDADKLDGLTEASCYGVWSFPTLALVREYENGKSTEEELGRWMGVLNIDKINEVLRENIQ